MSKLTIQQFKIVRNRQRPDLCYAYEYKNDGFLCKIFTMNSGKTFLASIEERRMDGRYYDEFNKHGCISVDEALEAINSNIIPLSTPLPEQPNQEK